MAQFRLTQQFAKDLKVIPDESPDATPHPLDDWIADVFRVNRKKVAIVTHVDTLISFIFPYSAIGGAKNVLDFLPLDIEEYLRDQNFEAFVESMLDVFNQPPIFTKTKNQKILGHMNDFKRIIQGSISRYQGEINWHEISNTLKITPVNINGIYLTPEELFKDALRKCITIS
jgi:hypothetical protein